MEKPSYKWRLFLGLLALGCFAMAIFNSIQVAHGQHPTDHAVNAVVQFLGVIALIVYYRRRNEAPLTLDISRKQVTSTNTELKAKS
jgi:hypothetical protein